MLQLPSCPIWTNESLSCLLHTLSCLWHWHSALCQRAAACICLACTWAVVEKREAVLSPAQALLSRWPHTRNDSSQPKIYGCSLGVSLLLRAGAVDGGKCSQAMEFAVLAPHSPHHSTQLCRADPARVVGTSPSPDSAHLVAYPAACACAAPRLTPSPEVGKP